jgi:hypothetical protein
MGLQSKLFRGDPKLEAAAVSDPAHITLGASGPHVLKIQTALNLLDGAGLDTDSKYGPATAAAVLAYKRERNIVNRSYQATADNIVGKMTIAALDAEMLRWESQPTSRIRIMPLSYWVPRRPGSGAAPAQLRKSLLLAFDVDAGTGAVGTGGGPPHILPGPDVVLQLMDRGPRGRFIVTDGWPGEVVVGDPAVARIAPEPSLTAPGSRCSIMADWQAFVVEAVAAGVTTITASKLLSGSASLEVVVESLSIDRKWRPQWTAKKTSNMWVAPFASHAFSPKVVPGVKLKSPWFEFTGSVDPDATVARGDFELGILQAVLGDTMRADYVDASGKVTWTFTISTPTSRDTADGSPLWYAKNCVKPLSARGGETVNSSDGPENIVPWQTNDMKGSLAKTSGTGLYSTWLVARQKSTGTFTFLAWARWRIDWGCTFDFATSKMGLTGDGTITDQGTDSQGPATPITGGQSAIDQTTMTWTAV